MFSRILTIGKGWTSVYNPSEQEVKYREDILEEWRNSDYPRPWEDEPDFIVYKHDRLPVYFYIWRHAVFYNLNGYIHIADKALYEKVDEIYSGDYWSTGAKTPHGGWTYRHEYSETFIKDMIDKFSAVKETHIPEEGGILGFDTAHHGDLAPTLFGTKRHELSMAYADGPDKYWTVEDVYEELSGVFVFLEKTTAFREASANISLPDTVEGKASLSDEEVIV